MFPKLSKKITKTHIKFEQKFVGRKLELIFDRFKCVGCGICSNVCPKDAISIGPGVSVYNIQKQVLGDSKIELTESSIDETKCVFCGACTILCPFDALDIYENGKRKDKEQNTLLTKKAIPKLEMHSIPMTRLKRNANVYWEGEIDIKYEFPDSEKEFRKYYLNKCPGDCRKCMEICPNEAISFPTTSEAWKSKKIINIDENKCIICGACQNVCPQSNFDVKWTKINFSGKFNERFWNPLLKKVLHNLK